MATPRVVGNVVGGVDIESERLVAVLERSVHALALLATLPTPETSVSVAAFLHNGDGGDDTSGRSEDNQLTPEVVATLTHHFGVEAALVHREAVRQERQATRRSTKSTHHQENDALNSEGPEVDADNEKITLRGRKTKLQTREASEDGNDDDADDDDESELRSQEEAEPGDDDKDAEDDLDWLFPRSLFNVLRLVSHDKAARDALRRLSATRISSDFAAFVHGLTDLIVLTEQRLSTTVDQDDTQRCHLRDATQRLGELQDDAAQLRFELASEREQRHEHALKHVKTISTLREQLSATERHATETLRATQRQAEQDAQALGSQFEVENVRTTEQLLALQRVETRVADAHQLEEADDRKRETHVAMDLNELLAKYDADMAALDDEIAQNARELVEMQREATVLSDHFVKVDEDRRHQLEEKRQWELEQQRLQREAFCMLRVVAKLQAVVRGFLTRRRVRLKERLRKKRKTKKKGLKKKKTKSSGSTSNSSTIKKPKATASLKPQRPSSAGAAATRRPTRPTSAAATARRS